MKQNIPNTTSHDGGRLQPQAGELEQAILGALMIESRSIDSISGILSDDDFYFPQNGTIYKAICQLSKESNPIDMLTVSERLKKNGELERAGGLYYISHLTTLVASSSHLVAHALAVKEKSIRRQAIIMSSMMADMAYSEQQDIEDVLVKSAKELDTLIDNLIGKSNGKDISEILKKSSENLYKRVELARKNIHSGIDTGLHDLNRMTNGWQPSELIIIAARPAMGKTAVMLHSAKAAAKSGTPVAIFSLEMSDVSLADRLILSVCKVESERYKSGYLTNEELDSIERAKKELYSLPIYVDDNPCVSMSYIRSRSKLLNKQGKCSIIMADYLQLAESDDKEQNREREVSKMSRLAKVTAKELHVPFILLSQLNRMNESRPDKKPLLSDLRESGAIEQDADKVIFIYRPCYYGIQVLNKEGFEETNYGELIVAKNRDGATGTVKFKYNDSLTKFYDYGSDLPF